MPSHSADPPLGDDDPSTMNKVFKVFLQILKVVTILALLLAMCTFGLGVELVSHGSGELKDKFFVVTGFIGYLMLTSLLVLSEMGPKWFLNRVAIMRYWIPRGLSYVWLGVQTLTITSQVHDSKSIINGATNDAFSGMGQAAGWSLIGLGLLFILMSLLCLKRLCGIHSEDESSAALLDGDKNPGSLPEDLEVITNMSLALDMSPSDARKYFTGKKGVAKARQIRNDRAAALADNNHASATYTPAESPMHTAKNFTPTATTPAATTTSVPVDDDDDNPRARRMRDDDDLEAAYYGAQS